jgi:hypothetical protein
MATESTLIRSENGYSSLDPTAELLTPPAGQILISGDLTDGSLIKIRAGEGVDFGPNYEFWGRITARGATVGSTLELSDGATYRVGRRALMTGYSHPTNHRPVHSVFDLPWGKGIAIGSLDEPASIEDAGVLADPAFNSSVTFEFNTSETEFNSSVHYYPRTNALNVVTDQSSASNTFNSFNIKEDWFGHTLGGSNNGTQVDFYDRMEYRYFGGSAFSGCNGLTSNTIGLTNMVSITAVDPAAPTVPLDCPIIAQKFVKLGAEGSVTVTLIADRSDGGEPYIGKETQYDDYYHDVAGSVNAINRVQWPAYTRGFQPFMSYHFYTSEKYYSERPNRVELCNQIAVGTGTRKISLCTPVYWSPTEIWAIVEAGMFHAISDFEGSGVALRIFNSDDEFVAGKIL